MICATIINQTNEVMPRSASIGTSHLVALHLSNDQLAKKLLKDTLNCMYYVNIKAVLHNGSITSVPALWFIKWT